MDAVEEGDSVRRDPDTDVGEIWDSDSLNGLNSAGRRHPSVRVEKQRARLGDGVSLG